MVHEMPRKLYFMKCSERKISQCILPLKIFFKSKKKDLSINSEESGESSKKKREGSLNDSSVSED